MSDEPDDLDDDLRAVSARLSQLRYAPVAGRWEKAATEWRAPTTRLPLRLAIAAAAMLAVGVVAMRVLEPSLPVVVTHEGASETRRFTSRWLETGAGEVATVTMAGVGTVSLQPGSKVRLKATGPARQRLELERGELRAAVSAPPRLFVVDTPGATAVDLGCIYTLAVVDADRTVLTVEEGEVLLEGAGHESRVLAGMRASSGGGRRPSTPLALDAPEVLRAALKVFDETGDAEAVIQALDAARAADAPTLWHLLARVDQTQRGAVAQRLASFVPAPGDFTEQSAGEATQGPMLAWWQAIRAGR
jgi:ferric-dicitrate binding protein FerR (iron transport regulator)